MAELRWCESPGNAARIAALSDDQAPTAITGCPHMMVAHRARVRVAAWVAVERRHCASARCGHCSTCASDQMLRRIIPTAERTVTRGGNKTIDKGDAI